MKKLHEKLGKILEKLISLGKGGAKGEKKEIFLRKFDELDISEQKLRKWASIDKKRRRKGWEFTERGAKSVW